MVRQQPSVRLGGGIIKSGVIIRHLVLPGSRADSLAVVGDVATRWKGKALLSLMSQYTPQFNTSPYPELNRRVTTFEYNSVLERARALGLDGYMQSRSSGTAALTPGFEVE